MGLAFAMMLPRRLLHTLVKQRAFFMTVLCFMLCTKLAAAQGAPFSPSPGPQPETPEEDENDEDDTLADHVEPEFITASIAFVAAFGGILVVTIILALILQVSNPPRAEPVHPANMMAQKQRASHRSHYQTRTSQQDVSGSSMNLLNRMPPAAMSSPTLDSDPFEGGDTKQAMTSTQYVHPMMPASSGVAESKNNQLTVSDTGRHKKKRRSRALPQPPLAATYSDQGGSSNMYYQDSVAGYSDASAGHGRQWNNASRYTDNPSTYSHHHYSTGYFNEVSPFNAYEVTPPVTQQGYSSYRNNNGYKPLPEPTTNYFGNQEQYLANAPATAFGYPADQQELYRKPSGATLGRVDSVSAGDYRRHSQRGKRNKNNNSNNHASGKRDGSSSGHYQTNRYAASQDVSYMGQPDAQYQYGGYYGDGAGMYALSSYNQSHNYGMPSQTYGYQDYMNYDMSGEPYPLRDEYKYSDPYYAWQPNAYQYSASTQ